MKKTILLFLLLGFNQALFAQNSLTIESLLNFKRIGAPASSPDGKNLCYALEEVSIEKNKGFKDLYVISSDGKKSQRISETPDKEWNPIYSHDGSTIFFLCNEGGSPQVWSCKTDGSSRKKITDVKDGVGGFHINTAAGKIYLLSEIFGESSEYVGLLEDVTSEFHDGCFLTFIRMYRNQTQELLMI